MSVCVCVAFHFGYIALNSPVQAPNPHSIPRVREKERERGRERV